MKPTYQLARAAAIFQSQYDQKTGITSQEYRDARQILRNYRDEHSMSAIPLVDLAAEILAQYVLSIPDQFEAGKRAEPNPMPSLFDRFGGPVK